MSVKEKQKYSSGRMEKLREYLQNYYDMGDPIDYEILVDGLKAVRRTNNPELFSMHENFIENDTRQVEVLFYLGTSKNNEKFLYYFGEDKENSALNGVEQFKKEWEYDQLKKENEELKEEVSELEDEIEGLEEKIIEYEKAKSPLNGFIGEIGSSFVESFILRNPKLLAKIPGGQALAGLLENPETKQENPQDNEVSFRSTGSEAAEKAIPLSEDDKAAVLFVRQLKSAFDQKEFETICKILQSLADDKTGIEEVFNFLSDRNNKENTEENGKTM